MTRERKAKVMDKASDAINRAKDSMYSAVQTLQDGGLYKDAETLMNMIYRLEKFQNKYEEGSLYNR